MTSAHRRADDCIAQEACVDVRIGVIHTVKEIEVELPTTPTATTLRRPIDDGARRRRPRCCGSPTGTVARSRCPPPRSPTSSSAAPTASAASASAPADARRHRASIARHEPDLELLDRRLLFVTGKGGVGKTSVAAALGLLAADAGQAHAASCEVDAKGNLADFFETGPTAFAAARGRARPVRHGDEHRGVAEGVPRAPAAASRCSPGSARSPAAFDFVATAAPGREGDPHRRQAR